MGDLGHPSQHFSGCQGSHGGTSACWGVSVIRRIHSCPLEAVWEVKSLQSCLTRGIANEGSQMMLPRNDVVVLLKILTSSQSLDSSIGCPYLNASMRWSKTTWNIRDSMTQISSIVFPARNEEKDISHTYGDVIVLGFVGRATG